MSDDLIADAVKRYPFRARRTHETASAYRDAVIHHVHSHDFAAAHELRLNKRQADWTSADAQGFRERLQSLPRSAHNLDGVIGFPVFTLDDQVPVSDDQLLVMAKRASEFCVDFRTKDPTREFQIMLTVLLATGQVLHALPSREDRIRALKMLGKQYPVYGYVLAADMFIHVMTRHPVTHLETATKSDGFVVHVGSRTLRRVFTHEYRVEGGQAVFRPTRELDTTMKNPEDRVEDPYADVFVSVPMPEGKPS